VACQSDTPQNVVKWQLPRGNTPRAYSLTLLSLSTRPTAAWQDPAGMHLSLSLSLISRSPGQLRARRWAPTTAQDHQCRPRPPTVSACLSNFFVFLFSIIYSISLYMFNICKINLLFCVVFQFLIFVIVLFFVLNCRCCCVAWSFIFVIDMLVIAIFS
jgi:hypothetical protein